MDIKRRLIRCQNRGDCSPAGFIPNAVRNVNPPCSAVADSTDNSDAPISSTFVREGRLVSFSTTWGKKIKAQWSQCDRKVISVFCAPSAADTRKRGGKSVIPASGRAEPVMGGGNLEDACRSEV